jgi:hypothetical protein
VRALPEQADRAENERKDRAGAERTVEPPTEQGEQQWRDDETDGQGQGFTEAVPRGLPVGKFHW